MSTDFPTSNDVFTEPSSASSVPLKLAGTGARVHSVAHADLGDAIEALQEHAVLLSHDHSGADKLLQANTHATVDTNLSAAALHHTIGVGATHMVAGNHDHDGGDSLNIPQANITNLSSSLALKQDAASASPFARAQHMLLLIGMHSFGTAGSMPKGEGIL